MDKITLNKILDGFKDISILVIGDYFLDKYLLIDPSKDEPSLETGLTTYQVVGKRMSPGAAGTVTNNLTALGVGKVIGLGFIGNDGEGYELLKALESTGVQTECVIKTDERITPTYTKLMNIEGAMEREIRRLDIKNWSVTPKWLEDRIINRLFELSESVNAIIALDQVAEKNSGMITDKVREALAEIGRSKKDLIIYADSRAYITKFKNIIIKCNNYEVVKAVYPDLKGEPNDELIKECGIIAAQKTNKPVFITCGARGQIVVENGKITEIPALKVNGPLDICGAGDAATSGVVSSLCCGASLSDAALIGNIVSSITIQQLGTTGKASPDQVMDRYENYFGS